MSYAELYRAPVSGAALTLSPDWRSLACGEQRYAVEDQIPDFLGEAGQGVLNDKYMRFYDKVSAIYKLGAVVSMPFTKKWNHQLMGDFSIAPGAHVLETSVGAGNNLGYLHKRFPDAIYYGMDISRGMLRQCRKNLSKWKLPAHLARANAQALPYPDTRFDLVFHIGGINYFDDKAAAVGEMIRVAKPGSRIVIIDETDRWVRSVYQRMPGVSNYYREMDDPTMTSAPVQHVPREMEDIRLELIWKGGMYKLSFVKPM